jgi:hypothetical protein
LELVKEKVGGPTYKWQEGADLEADAEQRKPCGDVVWALYDSQCQLRWSDDLATQFKESGISFALRSIDL